MATPEYINTLVTKFAAARATRLNLVKQAGMVPPADRAATLNNELDYYGYTNASPSSILSPDPSRSSLFHPSQLLGDTTVDQLDQSLMNPDLWTQNAADYVGAGAAGGLLGNKWNNLSTGVKYRNNGIPTNTAIRALTEPQLSAFIQARAGDGKGSTRFSVGPTSPGWKGLLTEQLFRPQMPSESTPAMDSEQRAKALRAARDMRIARGFEQNAVTAPLEKVEISKATPAVAAVPPVTFRAERAAKIGPYGHLISPHLPERPATPGTAAVAAVPAVTEMVPAKNWANAPASPSAPARNLQPNTFQIETTTPGKSLTGKPQDAVNRQVIRPNESATSFTNRPGAAKSLGWGVFLSTAANALKNILYHNSLFAPASMPLNVDEAGYPTPSSVAKMKADAANASR